MTDVPVFHKTMKQQSRDLDSITHSQVIPYGVVHIPEAKKALPPWLARGWHFKHFYLNTFAKFHKSFIPGRLYCLLRNRMRNFSIFFFFFFLLSLYCCYISTGLRMKALQQKKERFLRSENQAVTLTQITA